MCCVIRGKRKIDLSKNNRTIDSIIEVNREFDLSINHIFD